MTQRQFVTAYRRGEADEEELTPATNRYSELGVEPQKAADEFVTRTGSGGVKMLDIDACNSPCGDSVDVTFEAGRRRDESDHPDLKELLQAEEAGKMPVSVPVRIEVGS